PRRRAGQGRSRRRRWRAAPALTRAQPWTTPNNYSLSGYSGATTVPAKQSKRGRLWSNEGSCIRLRAERPNHVWSYDFVEERTHDGRKFRMLNIIDEFTHECLAIRVSRRLKSIDVIDVLSDLFILRGVPG